MFEDRTAERIKAEILQGLKQGFEGSAMPGSFADAMAGPVSEELAACYASFPAVAAMLFVDEGSGPFIDAVAAQYYNLSRRPGTRAAGEIILRGDAGVVIPKDTVFLSAEGLGFALQAAVPIGADGEGRGRVEALSVGKDYNLPAGALLRMYINLPGLSSFVSAETRGGTDAERDTDLLARIDARRKRPATSGNMYHYQEWALSVPGVGLSKIVALAAGPGTVSVSILDTELLSPSAEMLSAVREKVELERPIGAAVTVTGATALPVALAATVVLTQGAQLAEVQALLSNALADYCHELTRGKFSACYAGPGLDLPYDLLYNRVAALLMGIAGVRDFSNLRINGAAEPLRIPADQFPQVESVVLGV